MDSAAAPEPGSLTPIFVFYAVCVGLPLLIAAVVVAAVLSAGPLTVALLVAVAVVLAAYLTRRRYQRVDEVLLDELDVVDADEVEHARAYNLLEALSLRSGVAAPELYLSDDQTVNAAAIKQAGDAAAVITAGAASRLDRLQLEGLLAEVIVRIASGDARAATVATGMLLPFTDGPFSFLSNPATALIDRALHPDRELGGDMAAVKLTRYPPGLRDVLSMAGQDSGAVASSTGRLWVIPPSSHPARHDLDLRLAVLTEF
ncbi:MAG: hypothetical protein HKN24_04675 [Acidimicrobiales bacterium]|nr:hypothetical protein [Acidimicrobiales bacterium]